MAMSTLIASLFQHLIAYFLIFIGFLFIYVTGVAIYRLTLHPLAAYPGPFLAKITDIHLAYHAWKGDRHLEFYRCHEIYGTHVRMGPNLLSINSNTALKAIYGHKANVRKADFYTAFPANKHTFNVHSSIDKTAHARKRRVLSHAFSDLAIKTMEKYVIDKVQTFSRVLPRAQLDMLNASDSKSEVSEWSAPRNMAGMCDWLAFDIMGELAFGKSFDMLESPTNRFASTLVGNAAHRHLICGTHLTIHNWHLDKVFFRKIAASRAQYMAYSRQQMLERTKLGLDVDRKDFFYYLLNAKDPETGHGFTSAELWGESNLLIIAGSDTTSTALAATFFYLVHNPEVLAKAAEEVRSTFESVDEIVNGAKLTSCHYLRACIDESMRMSPPVGGGLPRHILPGGLDIEGVHYPAGIDICVPHYTIHHNATYYPSPFTYDPTRWIPDIATPAVARYHELAQSAFCAFSIGPRGCIGKGLAYVEMMSAMARTLWLFDMRLAPGTTLGEGGPELDEGRRIRGEYQLMDTFTSMKDGPLVQFSPARGT